LTIHFIESLATLQNCRCWAKTTDLAFLLLHKSSCTPMTLLWSKMADPTTSCFKTARISSALSGQNFHTRSLGSFSYLLKGRASLVWARPLLSIQLTYTKSAKRRLLDLLYHIAARNTHCLSLYFLRNSNLPSSLPIHLALSKEKASVWISRGTGSLVAEIWGCYCRPIYQCGSLCLVWMLWNGYFTEVAVIGSTNACSPMIWNRSSRFETMPLTQSCCFALIWC